MLNAHAHARHIVKTHSLSVLIGSFLKFVLRRTLKDAIEK